MTEMQQRADAVGMLASIRAVGTGMHRAMAEAGVAALLQYVGEDVTRDGLCDTPARVVRAYGEMTSGYAVDVPALLATTFEADYTGMVVVNDVDFVSLCEHHLLPFTGVAHVAYIPAGGRVVGLSKLARLVDAYARRLQVQERMTEQIADAIETALTPAGIGVVLRAQHACMACRGVRKATATMVTSALRGLMFDQDRARAEFLALAQ